MYVESGCELRPFFSDISSLDGETSTTAEDHTAFVPTKDILPHEYVQQLLSHIDTLPMYCSLVELHCENGVVTLPLIPILLVWSGLLNSVKDMFHIDADIKIIMPCSTTIAELIKGMILTGRSPPFASISVDEKQLIKELGFDFEVESFNDSCGVSDCGTIILGESSDEDSDIGLENDYAYSIDEYWERNSQMQLKPIDVIRYCSPSCQNSCDKVVESWKGNIVSGLKDTFRNLRGQKLKNKLINYLYVQSLVNNAHTGYVVNGHKFCLKYLSHLTGCKLSLLKKVLEDYGNGVRLYQNMNNGILKNPSSALVNFIAWFKNYLSLVGQSSPTDQVTIISYWLKPKVLYKSYIDESPEPHIALKTFYHHLKTTFGPKRVNKNLQCLRISKYSSHSVCDTCSAFNSYQVFCKTEGELEMLKSLKNEHKLAFSEARKEVESLRQHALDFSEDSVCIQIDGMNNWSSYLPRFLLNSKKLAGTMRLTTKITGCIIWSGLYPDKRKDIFYVNHDQYGRSPSLDLSLFISFPFQKMAVI